MAKRAKDKASTTPRPDRRIQRIRDALRRSPNGRREAIELARGFYGKQLEARVRACVRSADVQDVCQRTWELVCEKIGQWRSEDNFLPWLYKVMRTASCEGYRKDRRRRSPGALSSWASGITARPAGQPLSLTRQPTGSRTFSQAHYRLGMEKVWPALQRLDPEDYQILIRHVEGGEALAVIAAGLGITPDSARQRFRRARQLLMRELAAAELGRAAFF